jgi:hypothetical protein
MKSPLINRWASGSVASVFAFLISTAAVLDSTSAQTILSDTFNVTGGNSPSTGFGTDGVNYDLPSRLSGSAFVANPGMSLLQGPTGKPTTVYSITGNQAVIGDVAGNGGFQYSADGFTAYNFGSELAGLTYEIKLTLTQGETEGAVRRASFYINDNNLFDVAQANYGFQVASNLTSGGLESAYQRLRPGVNPTAATVNQQVASGLAYNQPVEFRLIITDSTDYTAGIYLSTYTLYVNDVLSAQGNFRFANGNRYMAFDVAPNSGPASFDNFSVTVIPEPSTMALGVLGAGIVILAVRRRVSLA